MCAPGHAEWGVCLLLELRSASPTLGRRQLVMRAAEWADQGGAETEQEVRGELVTGGRGGIWSCSTGGNDSITKGEGRGEMWTH